MPIKCVKCGRQKSSQCCYQKQWSIDNRAKISLGAKRRREANIEGYKSYQRNHYLNRHGITAREYELILTNQQGCCALCFKNISNGKGHLDHFHGCDIENRYGAQFGCPKCIRGILCSVCNRFCVIGIELLSRQGLYQHPYLSSRPLVRDELF